MSLATVYKALKTLVEVNLVKELNVGEGNFRYDANTHSHPHIQCVNCGRVDDIEEVSFSNLNDEIKISQNITFCIIVFTFMVYVNVATINQIQKISN